MLISGHCNIAIVNSLIHLKCSDLSSVHLPHQSPAMLLVSLVTVLLSLEPPFLITRQCQCVISVWGHWTVTNCRCSASTTWRGLGPPPTGRTRSRSWPAAASTPPPPRRSPSSPSPTSRPRWVGSISPVDGTLQSQYLENAPATTRAFS